MRALANRSLVTAENGAASAPIANRTDVGLWETFSNRDAVGPWEAFQAIGQ